jgi:hypothetical protein
MEERNFKNVIAILDNNFGNLRIIKDDNNNMHINDVDLTNAAKNLLLSMIKYNYKLFLLIRKKDCKYPTSWTTWSLYTIDTR